jgi:hypothetical protein
MIERVKVSLFALSKHDSFFSGLRPTWILL